MLGLPLGPGGLQTILAIGCHSDDIEIGAGGAILTLTRSVPGLAIHWVVLSAAGTREQEARESAVAFTADAGETHFYVHAFRDGFMPYEGGQVKEAFERLKPIEPDLILTHCADDSHQDHRLACELTWNTFRRHTILEYEIPKVDGDIGRRNVYLPLTEAVAREKVSLVERMFATQRAKHWFDAETFLGLMRLRGLECVAPERYAEGFSCRKVVLVP